MAWRATIRSATLTKLTTWAATTTGIAVHKSRPRSLINGGLPAVYIGGQRQDYTATAGSQSGLRRAEGSVDLVLVGKPLGDAGEEADELDTLADSLVESLSSDPHFIAANTVAEPVSVFSSEDAEGDIIMPTVIVTVGRIIIREGR